MNTNEHVSAKKNIALKYIMIIFVLGVFIATLFVFIISYIYGYDVLAQIVNSAGTAFAIWRLFIFITIVAGWNLWIEKLSAQTNISDAKKQLYLNYRWRFALWLLVIEVLLMQDVLADFFSLFIN